MDKRKLGNSTMEISRIGFGAWAIGGVWTYGWGPQDDAESIKTIHEALDRGVNWIDTAAAYGLGHSEEVVGNALRERSDKPFVFTKCGIVWDEKNNVSNTIEGASIRREIEASLKRLDVDVIDLYQIHWPNPDDDLEEAWATMAELIDQGKVRYIGVSNCSVGQMKRLQSLHPVASLQPPYSMVIRDVERNIIPYCGSQHIGIIPYSPMQRGLLTGKYTRENINSLDKRDHRLREPYFQEPELSVNLQLVEGLKPIAEENGRSLAQLAVAWVLRKFEVTAAIVGARRPSQIEETAPAAEWELSDEDIETIDALLEEREQRMREIKNSEGSNR